MTTSARRSPAEGGQVTAAAGRRFTPIGVVAGRGGPPISVDSRSRLASAPNAALLGARMDDLPAGRLAAVGGRRAGRRGGSDALGVPRTAHPSLIRSRATMLGAARTAAPTS